MRGELDTYELRRLENVFADFTDRNSRARSTTVLLLVSVSGKLSEKLELQERRREGKGMELGII